MEHHSVHEKFHLYIRGIILIGFTLLMLKLILTGNITNFIAPKMVPFIYFTLIVFLVLGVIQIWRSSSKHKAGACRCCQSLGTDQPRKRSVLLYTLFIIPIITGFLFPDIILDSSVASKRGFKTVGSSVQINGGEVNNEPGAYMEVLGEEIGNKVAESSNVPDIPLEHPEGFELQAPPGEYYEKLKKEMLEMETIILKEDDYIAMTSILDQSPTEFIGKEIELTGFVYREDDFESNQFVIARFGLSCCVADASIYGTLVTLPDANQYGDDQWVRVSGTLTTIKYQDWTLPYIKVTSIETVEQPKEPYVYESY